jgi:ABC-type Fe3+ transport system substrate-binding protein
MSMPVLSRLQSLGVRAGLYVGLLILILAAPFLLHSGDPRDLVAADRHLVIVSPHDQRIRAEVGRAFIRKWKAETGETLDLDWRIPGGSSEILLLLKSEYLTAFRDLYESTGRIWTPEISGSFASSGGAKNTPQGAEAREQFLNSSVGVGIDVIFGGGATDYQQLADAGYLVSGDAATGTGIQGVRERHPDWFSAHSIPESYGGERYRDAQDRWVGVVVASFGIIYNRDVYRDLGNIPPPKQWPDLADPRLVGHLALADPTKSGSVAKAFELMIQQQMLEAYRRFQASGDLNAEAHAMEEGWIKGLRLIQRLAGNARYFTDSAGKIGLEVARGDAAAGMAIDSYGHTLQEYVRSEGSEPRVGYVIPSNGTSLSADPVAMLRGAPEPRVATAFIEFLLSPEGQRIWAYKPGTQDGPLEYALRRFPVRRDAYSSDQKRHFVDPEGDPFERVTDFVYHPEWTQVLFPALRFIIRIACIDPHDELHRTWQAITAQGMNPEALERFHDFKGLGLTEVREKIIPVLRQRDKIREMELARILGERFRTQYLDAERIARGGKL